MLSFELIRILQGVEAPGFFLEAIGGLPAGMPSVRRIQLSYQLLRMADLGELTSARSLAWP